MEHPLPRAFGNFKGYVPLLDRICSDCNRKFGLLDEQLCRSGTKAFFRAHLGINFWIFKAGYTHEQQRTNNVTFMYKSQAFKPGGHFAAAVKPEDLQDELTKA